MGVNVTVSPDLGGAPPSDAESLGRLIVSLSARRATGALALRNHETVRRLWIFQGIFCRAESNDDADSLGALLVRKGWIPEGRLAEIKARQRTAAMETQDLPLMPEDLPAGATLRHAQRMQLQEVAASAFGWNTVTCELSSPAPALPESVGLNVDPIGVIADGFLRFAPAGVVDRILRRLGDGPIVIPGDWRRHEAALGDVFGAPLVTHLTSGPRPLREMLAGAADDAAAKRAAAAFAVIGVFPAGAAPAENQEPRAAAKLGPSSGVHAVVGPRSGSHAKMTAVDPRQAARPKADAALAEAKAAEAAADWDKARAAMARAIDAYPKDSEFHARMGWYAFKCPSLESAERLRLSAYHLEYALSLDPSDHFPHYYSGCVFGSQGNIGRAKVELTAALKASPGFQPAKDALDKLSAKKDPEADAAAAKVSVFAPPSAPSRVKKLVVAAVLVAMGCLAITFGGGGGTKLITLSPAVLGTSLGFKSSQTRGQTLTIQVDESWDGLSLPDREREVSAIAGNAKSRGLDEVLVYRKGLLAAHLMDGKIVTVR